MTKTLQRILFLEFLGITAIASRTLSLTSLVSTSGIQLGGSLAGINWCRGFDTGNQQDGGGGCCHLPRHGSWPGSRPIEDFAAIVRPGVLFILCTRRRPRGARSVDLPGNWPGSHDSAAFCVSNLRLRSRRQEDLRGSCIYARPIRNRVQSVAGD